MLIGFGIALLTGTACRAADAPAVGAPWFVERVPAVAVAAFEPLPAGPLLLSTLSDYALRTEGLQEVPAEWRQRRLEQLTASLEAHERASGIRLPRPVDDFAQYLLVTCDGMTGTYLATHDEGLVRGVAGSCSTMVGSIAA